MVPLGSTCRNSKTLLSLFNPLNAKKLGSLKTTKPVLSVRLSLDEPFHVARTVMLVRARPLLSTNVKLIENIRLLYPTRFN